MDSKCINGNCLSTGIEIVDNQHQNFFKLIERMRQQVLIPNKEQIDDIIDELFLYCLYHFETEERLLSEHNILLFSEHLKQHKNFTAKIEQFKIDNAHDKVELSNDLINVLEEWLKNHIACVDIKDFESIQKITD
ncbi:MAG: hypothetical protein BA863_08410 [Desulfovibrio sp. S3730MH75]|nr:MAG: hypothetical protein BA863_08410 [Desulfovibrio sp. S3730MH75]